MGFAYLALWPTPAYAKLENFQAADVVLGQPDFSQGTANNGGRGANTLNSPLAVFSLGEKLFIVDPTNHRVLIWNSIPTTNFAPADVVLGQPDFASGTANNGGRSARSLSTPVGVCSDGKRLFIADQANHRILIWNSMPTSNFAFADVVVGQANFTSGSANQGGTAAANTLNNPRAVWTDGKRLFTAENANRRVLIWNSIPTSNNVAANVVVGQPDFTTTSTGLNGDKVSNPHGVLTDGKRLFISDPNNNRILIYHSIPTSNGAFADVVIGQPDFTTGTAGTSQSKLSTSTRMFSDGQRLFVVDRTNNRVLAWDSIPTSNNVPADTVLGQPSFMTSTLGTTQRSFNRPEDVFSDGKRLFIVERDNHRLLLFNIAGSSIQLGPQFNQGKAVVGKVFEDWNGNGVQDDSPVIARSPEATKQSIEHDEIADSTSLTVPSKSRGTSSAAPSRNDLLEEKGIEGVKVVSDTGIYAITDSDGKYHFPFIETGQHLLKVDPATLPEGAVLTTESPRKVIVTKGMMVKVSFGVRQTVPRTEIREPGHNLALGARPTAPLLKVSLSQNAGKLEPRLSVSAKQEGEKIIFTTECNYYLFVEKAELILYDENHEKLRSIELPKPLPYRYEMPVSVLESEAKRSQSPGIASASSGMLPGNGVTIDYQLAVYDAHGRQDRTGLGKLE